MYGQLEEDQVCQSKASLCRFGNGVFEGFLRYPYGGPKGKCCGVKEERRPGKEEQSGKRE